LDWGWEGVGEAFLGFGCGFFFPEGWMYGLQVKEGHDFYFYFFRGGGMGWGSRGLNRWRWEMFCFSSGVGGSQLLIIYFWLLEVYGIVGFIPN
jgi:hypothetical protein